VANKQLCVHKTNSLLKRTTTTATHFIFVATHFIFVATHFIFVATHFIFVAAWKGLEWRVMVWLVEPGGL
jgi:hypothetical protein